MNVVARCAAAIGILLLTLSNFVPLAAAPVQPTPAEHPRAPAVAPEAHSEVGAGGGLEDFTPVFPAEPGTTHALSDDTQKAYDEALRAYYVYRQRGYQQRLEAFAWQAFSSKVIFVVVLVLVFTGIGFAAIQFRAGMRSRAGEDALDTEFAVDMKGLRVRSPVLGVVLLTISLAFFYLYLDHVYPIVNVF